MQALSSFNPDLFPTVQGALNALQDRSVGFNASSWYSQRGLFGRFVWPDWPEHLQKGIADKIETFHREHHGVQRITPGTPEWQAVFRDWRTDPESVSVIAEAFSKHFPGRVRWVESERDSRGRIGGHCGIEGAGEIVLHLSWRDPTAVPLGPLSDADLRSFQASVHLVFEWASARIQGILNTLRDRLEALYGERFRGLYVFGSYAKPDAGIDLGEDSDLDVALLLSDFDDLYEERKRFGDMVYDLSLDHGIVISVVPIREADFRDGQTNFTRVISSYAKLV